MNIKTILTILAIAVLAPQSNFSMEQPVLSARHFLLGTRLATFILPEDIKAKFESLCSKTIKAACSTLLSGKFEYFEGHDQANQCQINSLLVILAAQDDNFKQICEHISALNASNDLLSTVNVLGKKHRDQIRVLALNMLRVPHSKYDFIVDLDQMANQLGLTYEEKKLLQSIHKGGRRILNRIDSALTAELAETRLALCEQQLLNVESIRQQVPYLPIPLINACVDVKIKKGEIVKKLPAALSFQLFIAAVKESAAITKRPIVLELECNKKHVAFTDHTLQKFIEHIQQGPVILTRGQTADNSDATIDSRTGLLSGLTPEELLLSHVAEFTKHKQPEVKDTVRKFIPNFDEILESDWAKHQRHGITLFHMSPMSTISTSNLVPANQPSTQ